MDLHAEIVFNYQQKNYSECLALLKEAPLFAQEAPQYKVLEASCLIFLRKDCKSAHDILDSILINEERNAFVHYGKGLAYFSTKNMRQAIRYFDNAIKMDTTGSMGRALVLKQLAIKELEEAEKETEKPDKVEVDGDEVIKMNGKKLVEKLFAEKDSAITQKAKRCKVMELECIDLSSTPSDGEDSEETLSVNEPVSTDDNAAEPSKDVPNPKTDSSKKGKRVWVPKLRKSTVSSELNLSENHDDDKTCAVCSKTFTEPRSVKRHMKLHKSTSGYKCSMCDLTFIFKIDRARHEATHPKTYKHVCKDCGKRFIRNENYEKHRLMHSEVEDGAKLSTSGEESCDEETESAEEGDTAIIKKKIVSSNEKKIEYSCDQCSLKFESEQHLSEHAQTHKQEKPFGCTLCQSAFSSIELLASHFSDAHQNKK